MSRVIELDLPTPEHIRPRWAGCAAIWALQGYGDDIHADGAMWHYHDGGGNWMRLHLVPEGRAVLVGNDHEYSQTYYGAAAEYFGEDETDLFAGVPAWWREATSGYGFTMDADWDAPAFVYGFDGARWQRAEYEPLDGFLAIGNPALADDTAAELAEYLGYDKRITGTIDRAAMATIVEAGTEVTEAHLAAMLSACSDASQWDLNAAVEAARAFRPDRSHA